MHDGFDKPMTRSQEVLYDLCFERGLVPAKALAYRLGKSTNYISDCCRRDRVDFGVIFNEILKIAGQVAQTDQAIALQIAGPVAALIVGDTPFYLHMHDRPSGSQDDYVRLCEQTGTLMEDLGGAVRAIARIERDGRYDESDDADIAECESKLGLLIVRARQLAMDLRQRRTARSKA